MGNAIANTMIFEREPDLFPCGGMQAHRGNLLAVKTQVVGAGHACHIGYIRTAECNGRGSICCAALRDLTVQGGPQGCPGGAVVLADEHGGGHGEGRRQALLADGVHIPCRVDGDIKGRVTPIAWFNNPEFVAVGVIFNDQGIGFEYIIVARSRHIYVRVRIEREGVGFGHPNGKIRLIVGHSELRTAGVVFDGCGTVGCTSDVDVACGINSQSAGFPTAQSFCPELVAIGVVFHGGIR